MRLKPNGTTWVDRRIESLYNKYTIYNVRELDSVLVGCIVVSGFPSKFNVESLDDGETWDFCSLA